MFIQPRRSKHWNSLLDNNLGATKKIYRWKAGGNPQTFKSADEFYRVCKCAQEQNMVFYDPSGTFLKFDLTDR